MVRVSLDVLIELSLSQCLELCLAQTVAVTEPLATRSEHVIGLDSYACQFPYGIIHKPFDIART